MYFKCARWYNTTGLHGYTLVGGNLVITEYPTGAVNTLQNKTDAGSDDDNDDDVNEVVPILSSI